MCAQTTHRLTRQAMKCDFETITSGQEPERLAAAAYEALDEVQRLECCLSRFIETSDIARINASGAGEPVRVGPETIEVLQFARRLCEMTNDAFDVTAGPVTRLWREWRTDGRRPDRRRIKEALAHVGMHHVHIDPDERTVWLDHLGTEIDLGAIGKGLAVDMAMAVLARYGIEDAAVCGADSSMRVIGTAPGSPPEKTGWEFRPRNPADTSRHVSAFRLFNRAVGMSAQNEQNYSYRGQILGHIVDPRTGWPVLTESATLVVAPTAMEADALATAYFVLGPERTADIASLHQGVSVAFIRCGATPDEAQLSWIVRSEDLPAEPEPESMCRETCTNQDRRSENG
jgi:thiamine biosynthesis lipoprotein